MTFAIIIFGDMLGYANVNGDKNTNGNHPAVMSGGSSTSGSSSSTKKNQQQRQRSGSSEPISGKSLLIF